MKYSSNMLFMSIMVISTLIVISSNSWINMWIGLEINMIAFIAMIFKKKNSMSAESCMIYFLVQSMSSMLFLFMIISNPMASMNNLNSFFELIMIISFMMKLGVPPFHFWFPIMVNKMMWNEILLLMTWQKIAPMYLMSNLYNSNMILIIMMSTLVGMLGGLNQTSLRKIMAYSSINHMGWMFACMSFNNNLWWMYLMIYSILMIITVKYFENNSILYLNQIYSNNSIMDKIMISMMMMSLGGMPPLMGFVPKWMAIQAMMNSSNFLMMFWMVMMSLMTLFYYIRIMSPMMMFSMSMNKWNMTTKLNNNMIIFVNIVTPLMYMMNIM